MNADTFVASLPASLTNGYGETAGLPETLTGSVLTCFPDSTPNVPPLARDPQPVQAARLAGVLALFGYLDADGYLDDVLADRAWVTQDPLIRRIALAHHLVAAFGADGWTYQDLGAVLEQVGAGDRREVDMAWWLFSVFHALSDAGLRDRRTPGMRAAQDQFVRHYVAAERAKAAGDVWTGVVRHPEAMVGLTAPVQTGSMAAEGEAMAGHLRWRQVLPVEEFGGAYVSLAMAGVTVIEAEQTLERVRADGGDSWDQALAVEVLVAAREQ